MDEDIEYLRGLVNWGLERWVEIVGTGVTDLKNGVQMISFGGGFSVYSNSKELAETQGLEDTPITTYMVLVDKFRNYAASQSYTALQFLEDPSGTAASMQALGEVLERLDDPIATMLVEEFRSGLRDAAKRCGLEETIEAAVKAIRSGAIDYLTKPLIDDELRIAVEKGRSTRKNLKIGICGEHGGDPSSVEFCHLLGLNYVSCSPYRVPIARLAAAQAAIANAPAKKKGKKK